MEIQVGDLLWIPGVAEDTAGNLLAIKIAQVKVVGVSNVEGIAFLWSGETQPEYCDQPELFRKTAGDALAAVLLSRQLSKKDLKRLDLTIDEYV